MTVRRDPEFSNIYSAWCVSKQLRKIKQKAIEYKGGKCIECGYHKCTTSMVFHHRNPEEKEFNIGNKLVKWEIIRAELDKCDLLCMNCHGEIHEIDYKRALLEKEAFIRSKIPARKNKSLEKCICQHCKSEFTLRGRGGNAPNKYCSVKCKTDSSRKIPNSSLELQNLISATPIKILAADLGVTTRAIQKACKKLSIIIPKNTLEV
ncbi:hypothetical protein M0R72_00050 [Candidatus Pacearchaeota archaeon]|jgi:hypothetical protein|nr:hypothetical protein [Candidatus Pacearchaeota archaeon]